MTDHPPRATVRTSVAVPLALPDGFETTALAFTFEGLADGLEHVALGFGDRADPAQAFAADGAPPLARVHSECLTGDVFGSQRCDCGPQLHEAVRLLSDTGGYLLYLRQEGRGIGLYAKLDAYVLQDSGLDTYEANLALGFQRDQRDYAVAAQMLLALAVPRISLLTNNPDKVAQLTRWGISVEATVATGVHLSPTNAHYLATKATQGAHTIDLAPPVVPTRAATAPPGDTPPQGSPT